MTGAPGTLWDASGRFCSRCEYGYGSLGSANLGAQLSFIFRSLRNVKQTETPDPRPAAPRSNGPTLLSPACYAAYCGVTCDASPQARPQTLASPRANANV